MVDIIDRLEQIADSWWFWIYELIMIYVTYHTFADNLEWTKTKYVSAEVIKPMADNFSLLCNDCRLTSSSIDELVRRPRQMDPYGQVEDRIDLEKIKKTVCKDLMQDNERERCRSFYFTQQSSIQRWKNLNPRMSFFDFVCIKDLKFCCPENSFGLKCTKCAKCKPNERCDGDGTRSGSGSCICREGHQGTNCSVCSAGYYQDKAQQNTGHNWAGRVVCKPCHKSCSRCRGEGSINCEVCQSGYTWVAGFGCSDIDECVQNNKTCGENTFCVNTEGSYFCYECDRSCDGCYGDGPDMCLKCASGYKHEQGNCVPLKKTILPPEANYYRYAIYAGLCICTCIILHNNVYLASLVGLGVALYIGFSEYIMSAHNEDLRMKQQV